MSPFFEDLVSSLPTEASAGPALTAGQIIQPPYEAKECKQTSTSVQFLRTHLQFSIPRPREQKRRKAIIVKSRQIENQHTVTSPFWWQSQRNNVSFWLTKFLTQNTLTQFTANTRRREGVTCIFCAFYRKPRRVNERQSVVTRLNEPLTEIMAAHLPSSWQVTRQRTDMGCQ